MSMTFGRALGLVGASVPDHLVADAEVPVLTGVQAQGDLLVVPLDATRLELLPVPPEGVQVVRGEGTGNSHWLHRGFDSPGVTYARGGQGQCIMVVYVPDDQSAQLIHTDEHGANGIGAGLYAIHEKREQGEQIRRVCD
ncbi:MAG: hypothetical protein FWF02_13925 [Micrococcales bacterium]|nr:hypothetical protein [Micrococcales bacterium]MCL2668776.1 hypothetical protein [Micrococcales bacterium]